MNNLFIKDFNFKEVQVAIHVVLLHGKTMSHDGLSINYFKGYFVKVDPTFLSRLSL
jgi:hypothetical protein